MADMVIITVVGAEVMEEDIIVFMVAAVIGATMEVVGVAFLGNTRRLILMLNLAIKHTTTVLPPVIIISKFDYFGTLKK
jgi:hypothetical protein